MKDAINTSNTDDIISITKLSLSREQLIKQCVTLDLALARIELQEELATLSWNDWNFLLFKWPFVGKKELLAKIGLHIREIKILEAHESLEDLQDQYLLSSVSIDKIKLYDKPEDELCNAHSELCTKYFRTIRAQCRAKPPTSINDIEKSMDTFDDKLSSYMYPMTFEENYCVQYVLDNKISDDLRIIDTFFKVQDGNLGKYFLTIPPIKWLWWTIENIYNYFDSKSTTAVLNNNEIITESTDKVLELAGQHNTQSKNEEE